tara:strand:+ start:101 stop:325 length:225 start_codon:yes stop_codon:yes gene_type:complete
MYYIWKLLGYTEEEEERKRTDKEFLDVVEIAVKEWKKEVSNTAEPAMKTRRYADVVKGLKNHSIEKHIKNALII